MYINNCCFVFYFWSVVVLTKFCRIESVRQLRASAKAKEHRHLNPNRIFSESPPGTTSSFQSHQQSAEENALCFASFPAHQFKHLKANKVSKSEATSKAEYAYHFWKCVDAVYPKLSKLGHAWRNHSLPKLARCFETQCGHRLDYHTFLTSGRNSCCKTALLAH